MTPVSGGRKTAFGVLLVLALLALLPVWDGLASSAGIGLDTIGQITEF